MGGGDRTLKQNKSGVERARQEGSFWYDILSIVLDKNLHSVDFKITNKTSYWD